MSLVTNVLLHINDMIDEGEAEIYKRLTKQPIGGSVRKQYLEHIDMDGAGGYKFFESEVFAVAANFLIWEEFYDWIMNVGIQDGCCSIIGQEDEQTVILFQGGEATFLKRKGNPW